MKEGKFKMKMMLLVSLILSLALPARANEEIIRGKSKPSEMDIIMLLNKYYEGNIKFAQCMHKINYPPKPLSLPGLYTLTLTVAAYAEDIISDCRG
jgi:hypothetical protein